jgi:sporulation integral membrane protein YtvI
MILICQKWWRTVRDLALMLLFAYLLCKLFGFLWEIAKPLFIGYVLFLVIEPLARFLHKKGVKKIIATSISTLLFLVIVGGLFTVLGIIGSSQIQHLYHSLPKYASSLQKQADIHSDFVQEKINALPDNVGEKIHEYMSGAIETATEFAKNILGSLFDGLNVGLMFVAESLVGLVIAFLISKSSKELEVKYQKSTPKSFKHAYTFLKENVGRGIAGYIKAQLILMFITFVILFGCLLYLKVDNALTISLLSSIFSIVPVVGTATVIVPWVVYLLIVGHTALAIKVVIVQVILVALRHVVEPKLMADALGVSALKMFVFMIVSSSLYGVGGLFLTPILIIIYEALTKQGYFKKWIFMPAGEYDNEEK